MLKDFILAGVFVVSVVFRSIFEKRPDAVPRPGEKWRFVSKGIVSSLLGFDINATIIESNTEKVYFDFVDSEGHWYEGGSLPHDCFLSVFEPLKDYINDNDTKEKKASETTNKI